MVFKFISASTVRRSREEKREVAWPASNNSKEGDERDDEGIEMKDDVSRRSARTGPTPPNKKSMARVSIPKVGPLRAARTAPAVIDLEGLYYSFYYPPPRLHFVAICMARYAQRD